MSLRAEQLLAAAMMRDEESWAWACWRWAGASSTFAEMEAARKYFSNKVQVFFVELLHLLSTYYSHFVIQKSLPAVEKKVGFQGEVL